MDSHESQWLVFGLAVLQLIQFVWNGWLTFRNNELKARQEENHLKQEQNRAMIEKAKRDSDRRDDRTDNRVDLWALQNLRRGAGSAVQNQQAERKQKGGDMLAITVTDERVRAAFAPITPLLRELRKQYPDVVKFGEEVMSRYGKWIEEHICDVLGIYDFRCMAMAVSVSEESTKEHKILPPA